MLADYKVLLEMLVCLGAPRSFCPFASFDETDFLHRVYDSSKWITPFFLEDVS